MAASRKLVVEFIGDTSKLERSTKTATKSVGGLGKAFGALAGVFAAGELVSIGKDFVLAANRAEVSQKKLQAQLKATGVSYKQHSKQIDEVIQKTSQLSGLDDENLQDSFTNIIRVTGKVSESLKLTGLAADFARAKHLDVAKAGEIVGKVAGGNIGILSRYGISLGKGATAAEALAVLQKKFGGQAEAYGKTTQGAFDRLSVATENLKEKAGAALAPALASAANSLAKFATQMQNGTGAGGRFLDTLKHVFETVKTAIAPFVALGKSAGEFGAKHPIVQKLAVAVLAVGSAIRLIKWASAISGLSTFLSAAKALGAPLVTFFAGIGKRMGLALMLQLQTIIAGSSAINSLKAAGTAMGASLGGAFTVGFAAFGAVAALAFVKYLVPKLKSLLKDNLPGPIADALNFGADVLLSSPISRAITGTGTGSSSKKSSAPKYTTPKSVTRALGGPIPGVGNRDTVPALLTPGEHVWTKAEVQKAGGHRVVESMRAAVRKFATGGGVYGNADLQRLWVKDGGNKRAAPMAAAIALAESGGRPGATNKNTNGSIDRGLWQINSVHGALSTTGVDANARAAVRISGNGANWSPWVTFQTGAYKRYLAPAVKDLKGGKTARGQTVGQFLKDNPTLYERDGQMVTLKAARAIDKQRAAATKSRQAARPKVPYKGPTPGVAGSFLRITDPAGGVRAAIGAGADLGSDPLISDAVLGAQGIKRAQADAQQAADDKTAVLTDLIRQQVENQKRLLALATTQPGQLMAAFGAAVSGDIGGRAGLGFAAVGYQGGGVRY